LKRQKQKHGKHKSIYQDLERRWGRRMPAFLPVERSWCLQANWNNNKLLIRNHQICGSWFADGGLLI
jgi:hypothetical protein